MWRALFFAVGSMMIFVGLQSLAIERIELAPGKDVKQVIKRLLGEGQTRVAEVDNAPNPTVMQGHSHGGGSGSFGPSRFSSGGFGGSSFSAAPYRGSVNAGLNGGLAVSSDRASIVPRVDLAGYRSPDSGLLEQQAGKISRKPGRIIETKDWMPWSFLAVGAVIVLYTRSFPAGS